MKKALSILLSLCLGLFLADAVFSLTDDTLVLFFGFHFLSAVRGIVSFLGVLMAVLVYVLMGLTPMIPKRLFLPVTLFNPVAMFVATPFWIYYQGGIREMAWIISFCQVLLGLGILGLVEGFRFHWPLVAVERLGTRLFSWLNLSVFLLVNLLVLPLAGVLYLVLCFSLAVDHFSDGFLTLRPDGLTVQARKYVRDDGKTVHLIPMSHIGDAGFYRKISEVFPTNSIILMEGVSDERNLLTNEISYKRMATSLGLAEQQKEFAPTRGKQVRADVDVEVFSTNTIDFINLTMLIHTKGVNPEIVLKVVQFSPPVHFEQQLFEDLLRKRNRHLLEELHARLPQTENIIVPWGVAHMPEIAVEIQKAGFRLVESREYKVIRFRSVK